MTRGLFPIGWRLVRRRYKVLVVRSLVLATVVAAVYPLMLIHRDLAGFLERRAQMNPLFRELIAAFPPNNGKFIKDLEDRQGGGAGIAGIEVAEPLTRIESRIFDLAVNSPDGNKESEKVVRSGVELLPFNRYRNSEPMFHGTEFNKLDGNATVIGLSNVEDAVVPEKLAKELELGDPPLNKIFIAAFSRKKTGNHESSREWESKTLNFAGRIPDAWRADGRVMVHPKLLLMAELESSHQSEPVQKVPDVSVQKVPDNLDNHMFSAARICVKSVESLARRW